METVHRVPAGLVNERLGPIVVEDVLVAPPGRGEVRVRMQAAGLCHTDLTASRDQSVFPQVLGHEGTGVIDEVGQDVRGIVRGDTVALSWKVPCGACRACRRGRQPWCESPLGTTEPRVHRARDGAPVLPFLRTGSFCPYVVVPAGAAVPIPTALPPVQAALLGCGVATGVGAVLFDARVEPGMDVVVFGLGGVGLNVVQGARLAQARSIIAIDLVPEKLDLARTLGATDCLLAGDTVVEAVRERTDGRGVDVAFEVVGHPLVMQQALDTLAPGGTMMLVGAAARDAQFAFTPRRFISRQQNIRGCIYGACRPAEHFPLFAQWALEGKLQLDSLISRTLTSLEEINDAFAALQAGTLLRAVLRFPDA
jgi:S-(hydroxymethyl)glutathione dehydrogenase/alcohol dehydrogenase